ncbi:MAG: 30S ribosomal protein S13 [Candidatus Bathyarchaeia archaeon]
MSSEYRHIVRVLGTDLDGSKRIAYALTKIKGVGMNLAHAIVNALNLNPNLRAGELSDELVSKIEDALRDPVKYGLPSWLLNRRKDLESGRDLHLVGSDLDLRIRADIDSMKEIKSWRGVRHALGLKVRGQRTKTTGRRGKTVGVKRKRIVR